jgi:hypothetical protein
MAFCKEHKSHSILFNRLRTEAFTFPSLREGERRGGIEGERPMDRQRKEKGGRARKHASRRLNEAESCSGH